MTQELTSKFFASEGEAVAFVDEKYQESRKVREKLGHFQNWAKWYRFTIEGDQWEINLPSYKAKITVNLLSAMMGRINPLIMQQRPIIYFSPLVEDKRIYNLCTLLEKIFAYLWEELNFDSLYEMFLIDVFLYGTGIFKPYWDIYKRRGEGEVALGVLDPLAFFPDPNASDIATSFYCISAQVRSLDYIRKYYPERGHLVAPEASYSEVSDEERKTSKIMHVYPVDKTKPYVEAMEEVLHPSRDRALVKECWFEDLETLDDDGNLAYPNGRVVTVANEVRLLDRKNPYYFMKKFPYVRGCLLPIPRKFWGKSRVEDLISLQKEYNKRRSQIADNISLQGNPVWKISKDTGLDPNIISNKPGLVLPVNPTSHPDMGIQRDAPPVIPAYIIENTRMLKDDFDLVGRAQSILQGQRPRKGAGTGRAFESLSQAAIGTLGREIDSAQRVVGEVAYQIAALILQYYDTPRMVVKGKTGDRPEVISIPRMTLPDEYLSYPLESLFSVSVGRGTGVPISKEERKDDALVLHERGIIGEEEVLEAFEYPGRTEILLRRKKEKERIEKEAIKEYLAEQEKERAKEKPAPMRAVKG